MRAQSWAIQFWELEILVETYLPTVCYQTHRRSRKSSCQQSSLWIPWQFPALSVLLTSKNRSGPKIITPWVSQSPKSTWFRNGQNLSIRPLSRRLRRNTFSQREIWIDAHQLEIRLRLRLPVLTRRENLVERISDSETVRETTACSVRGLSHCLELTIRLRVSSWKSLLSAKWCVSANKSTCRCLQLWILRSKTQRAGQCHHLDKTHSISLDLTTRIWVEQASQLKLKTL